MKYAEYKLLTEQYEIDQNLYRSLLKDAAGADKSRLNAILETFMSLNVPEDFKGDVEDIYSEGLEEIRSSEHSGDMLEYVPLIWHLSTTVSDALFHSFEQLVEF